MPRYAAIDIGSNSIRMQAAEVAPGSPARILASERQVVRLGESVFRNGAISTEAMDLACEVLARMAEQYQKLDIVGCRAVATSAVRDARNQAQFLEHASRAIGAPVEIISGREEARLIHLGVQSRWPHPEERILIIDIGGGSAEIISSEHGRLRDAYSKPLGAVRLHEIFLPNDPPFPREIHQMHEYIEEKLAGAAQRLASGQFQRAIATAATASAIVCAINRVPRAKRESADRLRASTPEIRKLYRRLCAAPLAQRRKITGIGPRRAEIIIPGVSVLLHVLQTFGMRSVYYSAAGVRDGIIADLEARGVGRELTRLSVEQRKEVEHLASRYGVFLKHARKVAALSQELFAATQPLHHLPPQYGKMLEAASYLFDIGHFVSDISHHKHSYYLVSNSDLSGFTNREREFIANLCRYHRKALPSPVHSNYQGLGAEEKRALLLLIPLLRMADNLDRTRDQRVRSLSCVLRDGQFILHLDSDKDIDLEQWAAERAGDTFRQIYERPVIITRARA